MKYYLFYILPCILAACSTSAMAATKTPTESAFERTKLFAITADAETITASYPKNDATITAIMASKYVLGTAMAATMTALPTETPIPTIPPDSPVCHSADLRTSFGSNAATQQLLLGAGLTNISSTPCFLQAWPQVVLVDQQGKPLELDYGYFDMGPGDAGSAATQQAQESATAEVGLWPGWSAWLNLIWQNCYGESVSGNVVIRLTFSKDTGVLVIPTDIQSGGACNPPGQRSYVGISKLVVVPSQ
jgi:hypothetical protein